jgi:hypothetical protein
MNSISKCARTKPSTRANVEASPDRLECAGLRGFISQSCGSFSSRGSSFGETADLLGTWLHARQTAVIRILVSKLRLLPIALLLAAASSIAAADCVYPKAPQKIPDGKTATEAEMVEAMSAFKQYNSDVTSYSACVDKETAEKIRDAGNSTSLILQIKTLQSKKYNAAVDELQEKAKAFNEQVRLFKARK